jgi:hypothetical protein
MSRGTLVCVFAAAFLIVLAGTAPMSLALSSLGANEFGVSAANVSGAIWSAHLKDVRYREIPFGDVEASLDPLSLIGGTRRVAVTGSIGNVTLVLGPMGGFETAKIAMGIEQLGVAPPLTGTLRLESATVLFSDNRCSRAEGRIEVGIIEPAFRGLEMSGTLSCVGEAAMARLQGSAKGIEVAVTLRVNARARYEAHARVASFDPVVRAALAIAGFIEQGNQFVRSDEGGLGS